MKLEISYASVLDTERGRCLHVVTNWQEGEHYVSNQFWVTHYTLTAMACGGEPWSIFDLISSVISNDAPTARAMLGAIPLGLMFPPALGLH